MIGKIINRERERLGLSLSGLAREADVSNQTISILELGRKDPKVATLRRVLAALGIKAELLLTVNGKQRKVRL